MFEDWKAMKLAVKVLDYCGIYKKLIGIAY